MSDPQSLKSSLSSDQTIIYPNNDNNNNNCVNGIKGSSSVYIPIAVAKTTGTAAYYITSSSIARKAIFTGAMYFAGGTIISTVGLPAVIVTGALIWIL
jgi:hypothetical protein